MRLGWREAMVASAAVAAASLALLLWGAPPVTALALTLVVPLFAGAGVLHGLDRTMAWAPTVMLAFALSSLAYIAVATLAGEAMAEQSLYEMYYRSLLTAALCSSAYLAAYTLASKADLRFEAVELGEAFERAAEPLRRQLGTKEEGPRLGKREPLL